MSRYTTYCDGFFRRDAFKDRKVIVVDVRETESSNIADEFVKVNPGGDYAVLSALRAIVRGKRDIIPPEVEDLCVLGEKEVAEDGDEGAGEIYLPLQKEVSALVTTVVARAIVDMNRAEGDRGKDGIIKTPFYRNTLNGITQRSVTQIGRDLGFAGIEQDIRVDELYSADEVFLTNTARGIISVFQINSRRIVDLNRKQITEALRNKYIDIIKGKDSQYQGWLTYL